MQARWYIPMDVPDGGRAREQPPAGPQAACVIVGVCGNFFFTKCLATTFPAPRAPSVGPGGAAQLREIPPGLPCPAPPRPRQHAPLQRAIDGRNVPLFADVQPRQKAQERWESAIESYRAGKRAISLLDDLLFTSCSWSELCRASVSTARLSDTPYCNVVRSIGQMCT